MTVDTGGSTATSASPPGMRRAVVGMMAGQAVEWYDYLLYGYVATIIATTYFPTHSSQASLLAALGAYGLSFVIRPVGGVFWGHLSDRIGRTRVLALTVTVMSIATALFGVIPSYQSIGIWAPVLVVVVRLIQGFSAGGEATGVTTLIVEYSPARRRGFYLGFCTVGLSIACILAAGITSGLSAIVGTQVFEAWAWRIPFWIAAPLGLTALYLRWKVEETPVFKEVIAKGGVHKLPILVALRRYKSRIPLLIVFFGANATVAYYLGGFLPSYLQTTGGLTRTQASVGLVICYVALGVLSVGFGYLADLRGRRFIRLLSLGMIIVFAIPSIFFASTGQFGLAVLGLMLLVVGYAANQIATYTAATELYDPDVRASAAAFSYNAAYIIFGGTAPIIGTALSGSAGVYAVGGYLVLLGVAALLAVIRMPETQPKSSIDDSISAIQQSQTHFLVKE